MQRSHWRCAKAAAAAAAAAAAGAAAPCGGRRAWVGSSSLGVASTSSLAPRSAAAAAAAASASASLRGAGRSRLSSSSLARVVAPARARVPQQPEQEQQRRLPRAPRVKGVKRVVAVASGKGGVGKSSIAANLAVALARLSSASPASTSAPAPLPRRVALVDADIYGPSVPTLMGLVEAGEPETADVAPGDGYGRGRRPVMRPWVNYGVQCMSMGFLADPGRPMVWRGPLISSAVDDLVRGVAWESVDIMVVDLPPGTGDVQISLAQRVPLSGAIIVSTPQDLALIDAARGAAMFDTVDIPVLGVVENMSHFTCTNCGHSHNVFGHGGARQWAAEQGFPLLGEIPLHPDLRASADAGRPLAADPDLAGSDLALAFHSLAETLWTQLLAQEAQEEAAAVEH